ncbi:hypothetical protein CPBF1521_43780 [Xanthomonas arboricola pv. juglandis]|nr:hypothetical protein CPBF1521_43780 [Xanthomonas arboricola pv. juglandis]
MPNMGSPLASRNSTQSSTRLAALAGLATNTCAPGRATHSLRWHSRFGLVYGISDFSRCPEGHALTEGHLEQPRFCRLRCSVRRQAPLAPAGRRGAKSRPMAFQTRIAACQPPFPLTPARSPGSAAAPASSGCVRQPSGRSPPGLAPGQSCAGICLPVGRVGQTDARRTPDPWRCDGSDAAGPGSAACPSAPCAGCPRGSLVA